MSNYLFIESRDRFESRDTRFVEETAVALKGRGHTVTVFLLQNGVLAARRNVRENYFERLNRAGVTVLVDDFSLRERGIQTTELGTGLQESNIETLVAALVQENTRAIWH